MPNAKTKCKPVALDVWLHQEQQKAWRKEREIREIAHQKRQAEREIARQKRQAERAAAAAERRATRHAVVRALEASLRQDKDYRFGVQPCPWYALTGTARAKNAGATTGLAWCARRSWRTRARRVGRSRKGGRSGRG